MASLASGSSTQKLTKKILLERNKNLHSGVERFVEEFECVQKEIDALDIEANEKKASAVMSCENSKKPLSDKRDNLIKNIPNFWIKSFQNHPEISSLIDQETGERLRFLNRLEVQCVKESPTNLSFTINFFFDENPYFENEVLSKEIIVNDDGTFSSTNSPIRWKPGMQSRVKRTNVPSASRKRKFVAESFFDWFVGNTDCDTFADFFRDLHQKPLRYFRNSDDDDDSDSQFYDDGESDFTEDEEDEEMDM